MSCCTYDCNEGRDCPNRVPGMHTQPGGHQYHRGVSFPIEDEPIATPEGCGAWTVFAVVCFAALLAAGIGAFGYFLTT
jgi:hypothetical protein